MEQIETYILRTKEERQKHLKLDEACIERGGNSSYCKGLLAHIHDTSIPSGKKIHVCHACHNAKCSNPWHLYWGTASENRLDANENGAPNIWERMVAKYGLEEATKMQGRKGNQSLAGQGNKGKPKSPEHRQKIADAVKLKHQLNKNNAGVM